MVDVLDCDVRLPTPDDPVDPALALTKPNCYLAELIKLSILLGKVTKTIYSPSGLVHATDAVISQLLLELDLWRENLHPDLKFKGPTSILPAGWCFGNQRDETLPDLQITKVSSTSFIAASA